MDKDTKRWIFLMHIFSEYWGCHQMPERSFFLRGYQFPVCSRCTGMIFGESISIITLILGVRMHVLSSLVIMIPMILDGVLQLITNYCSNNIKRVVTGLMFGYGFIQFIYNVFIFFFKQ